MKNIIAIRHGDYNEDEEGDYNLTPDGRKQIITLAEFMKDNFGGTFYFASSPVTRVMQSAEILRDYLDTDRNIQTLYELNCEYDNLFHEQAEAIHQATLNLNGNNYAVGNFKLKGKEDNLILIGHYATAIDYSKYFMQHEWRQSANIDNIGKGRAIHLDLENRTQRIIPE